MYSEEFMDKYLYSLCSSFDHPKGVTEPHNSKQITIEMSHYIRDSL